jgi:hypothetical protein
MESLVRDEALMGVVKAGGTQKVCRAIEKLLSDWTVTLARLARSHVPGEGRCK